MENTFTQYSIAINSVNDMLKIASNLKNHRNHNSDIEFYRGQSNKVWGLSPSITRGKNLLKFENYLINEFIRRKPNEFPQSDGMFNNISKMQHHGLKTRLLDVTENPLVALYFACCDLPEEDGEIFTFQESLDEIPNNNILNFLANYYIFFKGKKNKIEECFDINDSEEFAKEVNWYIDNLKICIAQPKIISERMSRQSGAFIFFMGSIIKSKDYTNSHINNVQSGHRHIIKADRKKDILSELNILKINKAFLFPSLDNEALDIIEDYSSRIR